MAWFADFLARLMDKAGVIGVLLAAFLAASALAAHYKLVPKFTRKLTGALAILFVLFLFVCLFHGTIEKWLFRTQTVDVILRTEDGALVHVPFRLKYRLPERGVVTVDGREGAAEVRGVPTANATLDVVSVVANGWSMRKADPNFPIANGEVTVIVEKAGPIPPVDDAQRPDPTASMPSEKQLVAKPAVQPEQVTLHYANRTRDELVLVMYPYSSSGESDPWNPKPKWLDFPLSDEWQFYDKFKEGRGWFGLWVRDVEGEYSPFGEHNLFIAPEVWLTVDDDANSAKGRYKVSLSKQQPASD
jgi:hypothetical protein